MKFKVGDYIRLKSNKEKSMGSGTAKLFGVIYGKVMAVHAAPDVYRIEWQDGTQTTPSAARIDASYKRITATEYTWDTL